MHLESVKKKKACGSLKEKEGIGGGVHDQFEALYISLREGGLPHSAHGLQISALNKTVIIAPVGGLNSRTVPAHRAATV